MEDIHGKEIRVGMRVKTQQPEGGIFNPAPAEIGIVEECKDAFGRDSLHIRYRRPNQNFDRFILLEGKINEIVGENGN